MKSSALDPRSLLDALRAGTSLPDLPVQAVESARALAKDLGTATPASVEALPEPLAAALLEAAVLNGQVALPEALSASAVKPLAKLAKKALYRLRSRGVAIAEPPRTAPPEAPRPSPSPEALPALASTVTGRGERALVMGRVLRAGGIEMVQALISDEEGVLQLQLQEASRSIWRRILKDGLEQGGTVELPQHEAAALLAEAAGLNLRAHTPFPEGLDVALRHFGVQPQLEPTTLPPPEPEDVRHALDGDLLHETPELAAWLPPESITRRLLAKLDEVVVSPLALSDVQRQDQLQGAVRTVTQEYFTPDMSRRYALRLWRMADFFERTGRKREAEVARGEARRLFHGATQPFSRFAEHLFEKVVGLVAAAGAREEAAARRAGGAPGASAPSPAEAAPTQERRSPGGLILP
ncbi:hypothetical protein HUA74_13755 [Myxococcus sp. CA051A]|uniref:hypothetical protein n=1 Tax=unclassified Myxococcus TaxID=2648731 RepID=UPI00157A969C|nr:MULTISPECIES: hypothetical protein [unclassified Myxococcus]NTX36286.1 hypothetical protein [Myxococcus sp. CA033]NTX61722.1 hypothetical protein [Myxococcus sp. CA051A]